MAIWYVYELGVRPTAYSKCRTTALMYALTLAGEYNRRETMAGATRDVAARYGWNGRDERLDLDVAVRAGQLR